MSPGKTIGAVVLAAGYASRMGALKPLLPLGGSTVIEQAITRLWKAGIETVRVVVGHQVEQVALVLGRLGVSWVFNEHYEKGMLSSVLAGVRSLQSTVEAFFLLPVDIPLVKPGTLQTLITAYHEGHAPVIYPCFQGERGHPPLIARGCIPEDLPCHHPGGLRAFLRRYDPEAGEIAVTDEAVLMDCDTPADYERLKTYAEREDIPTERECRALWDRFAVPERVIAHSRTVGELARLLAIHLNRAGLALNIDLIIAAGYLHDVAKGQPDHAAAAARMLTGMGYSRVGKVVASHMDIHLRGKSLNEGALIYLADKCVDGDQLVPLETRFRRSLEKYAGRPEALMAIERRLDNARSIQSSIQEVLGETLDSLIQKYNRNIRAVSNSGPRKIYLVRHGAVQREGNARRFIGQLDIPLSSEGIQQVRRLRERLVDTELSAIFCSDLRRSAATAAILAQISPRLTPIEMPQLREINLGEWDGLDFDEVSNRDPEGFEERGRDPVHYQPPGGESFLDCTIRVIPAFYHILQSTRGNLLIVGHAGVNRIILCQVLGRSLANLFDVPQDYACLNVICTKDGGFEVKVLNGDAV